MITKGHIPFDILNYSDGKHKLVQVDATDEEVAAMIAEHEGDFDWDIRYKDKKPKKCSHEWVVHFIDRAASLGLPKRDAKPLMTDISVCRFCGEVSYIFKGKVMP